MVFYVRLGQVRFRLGDFKICEDSIRQGKHILNSGHKVKVLNG